jgi:hypothetical protein
VLLRATGVPGFNGGVLDERLLAGAGGLIFNINITLNDMDGMSR